MKKRFFLVLLVSLLAFCMMPFLGNYSEGYEVYAASSKAKTYNDVIKSGKKVYCSFGNRISVVNLKTGKVSSLVNRGEEEYPSVIRHMMIHKGYIYYLEDSCIDSYNTLQRVKVSGGKVSYLSMFVSKYMIKKQKIYFVNFVDDDYDGKPDKNYKRVMKLNGKSVRKSSTKVKMKTKASNKKGYEIIKAYSGEGETGDIYDFWLETPSGKKYYLGEAALSD